MRHLGSFMTWVTKVGSRSWASWAARLCFWIGLWILWRERVTTGVVRAVGRVARVGGWSARDSVLGQEAGWM